MRLARRIHWPSGARSGWRIEYMPSSQRNPGADRVEDAVARASVYTALKEQFALAGLMRPAGVDTLASTNGEGP